ncbi:MAG: hypothetical protein JWO56_3069 [Acidobacteria bacterium]|nr:hypothetical protein [Acidobacteriota bacterium]
MPSNSNPVVKPTSRRPGLFTLLGALWLSLLAVPVCLAQNAKGAKPHVVPHDVRSSATGEEGRVPATPAAVIDIVVIQPFRLKAGYSDDWLESRPLVSDGLLVVLRVDPNYVVPHNSAEPVLYAGDRTVQRLNQGDRSGYVVGIIPGQIDLASVPIWFGRPELPERVTPAVIKAERTLADSAGIKAFGPDKIGGALRDAIEVGDLAALLRGPAGELVLQYSPDEKDLVDTWRLPTTGSAFPR